MSRPAIDVMGAARLIVRVRTPYFRSALVALVPREAPGLGTIGVTQRGVLIYDPEFVARQSPAQCAGLLVHEICHLMNRHAQRCGARDKRLYNMAGDLAINPMIREMGFELPAGVDAGLFPAAFGWKEGLTADEYYKLLLEKQGDQGQQGEGKEGEGQGAPMPDGGQPGPARGKCGSCADGSDTQQESRAHAEGDGKTEGQLERVVKATAEAIRDHKQQKGQGTCPAGLLRLAEEMLTPPKVPWRSKLSRALRSACEYRPGSAVYRYDGPSRRQAGLGYGEGSAVLPRMRQPVPRVAIVADTSGSMGAEQLGAGLRESNGVVRALGGSVTFLACDAAVHALRPVRDVREMCALLKGGGGSSFEPAFAALQAMRPAPEVAIFTTDGMISVPRQAPPGMHVIWLIIGATDPPTRAYGECIVLDD